MLCRVVASAVLATTLSLSAVSGASADEPGQGYRHKEHRAAGRVEHHHGFARAMHRRYAYRVDGYAHRRHHGFGHRAWDGRYGLYPRQHLFVTGVYSQGYYGVPVNVATVAYRSWVYYTPTYPSVSHGYPPYAYMYDLTAGPVYNKPCLC